MSQRKKVNFAEQNDKNGEGKRKTVENSIKADSQVTPLIPAGATELTSRCALKRGRGICQKVKIFVV